MADNRDEPAEQPDGGHQIRACRLLLALVLASTLPFHVPRRGAEAGAGESAGVTLCAHTHIFPCSLARVDANNIGTEES